MKELKEPKMKFKLKKGTSLVIFGILIFIIGYVISDAGHSYSSETFLMMYYIGAPAFLIGLPIMINEIFHRFSHRMMLITGLALMIGYVVFWIYTLLNH